MKARLNLEKDDLLKVETKVKENISKEEKIPSNYIKINLVSDGKIEGVPQVLHFRDFTAGDVLEISRVEDDTKNMCKVLTGMNYEKFDISLLSSEDVLFIMVTLYANFISSTIEKEIYLNEDLPEGELEGQLDNASNKEVVEIELSKLKVCFLGKDENDNVKNSKLKVPFIVKDKKNGIEAKFKMATLKDVHIATDFCKEYFKDEYMKFAGIRSDFEKISNIKDVKKREFTYNEYLESNKDKCDEYFQFFQDFTIQISKIVQSLQILEYNGKVLEDLNEKMDIFTNKMSEGMWNTYTNFLTNFSFGILPEIEVFSSILQKKLIRRVSFRFEEFFPNNKRKDNGQYDITFD